MSNEKFEHIANLLPEYVSGSLELSEEQRVREHLRSCTECQEELASWQEVSEAVNLALESSPLPSPHVLEAAWATINKENSPVRARSSLTVKLSLALQLLRSQLPLVRRKIWVASAVTMAIGCLVALMSTGATGSAFAVFAPIVAAVGVAFIYGPENDPSLEIALSTPTKPRLVLLARLTLVYGYDLTLALAATGVLVLVKAEIGLWSLVSLWIGPMLFLSALALLLSLLFGSTAAVLAAMALWGVRLVAETYSVPSFGAPAGAEVMDAFWQTNTILLPLAVLLLAVSFLCVSYSMALTQGKES